MIVVVLFTRLISFVATMLFGTFFGWMIIALIIKFSLIATGKG